MDREEKLIAGPVPKSIDEQINEAIKQSDYAVAKIELEELKSKQDWLWRRAEKEWNEKEAKNWLEELQKL